MRSPFEEFANNQALNIGPRRLIVGTIGAVIANLGIRQDDDLPCIGGIGGNFLVAGKRSIKNHFALAFARVPMALAAEDAPVFERQDRLHCLSEEWIQSITSRCHPL